MSRILVKNVYNIQDLFPNYILSWLFYWHATLFSPRLMISYITHNTVWGCGI